MDMILHAALFKGYPIPPTLGEKRHGVMMASTRRKQVEDLRKRIIDAMIALGGKRLTITAIMEQINLGNAITHQMVMHHMKNLNNECIVKRNRTPKGKWSVGQRPSEWTLVL